MNLHSFHSLPPSVRANYFFELTDKNTPKNQALPGHKNSYQGRPCAGRKHNLVTFRQRPAAVIAYRPYLPH